MKIFISETEIIAFKRKEPIGAKIVFWRNEEFKSFSLRFRL
jgi:hypothetical protein